MRGRRLEFESWITEQLGDLGGLPTFSGPLAFSTVKRGLSGKVSKLWMHSWGPATELPHCQEEGKSLHVLSHLQNAVREESKVHIRA